MRNQTEKKRGGSDAYAPTGTDAAVSTIPGTTIVVEPMVSTREACRLLRIGASFMAKIKGEMGIGSSRKVFVSHIADYIRNRKTVDEDRPDPDIS